MKIFERNTFQTLNPVISDPTKPITESSIQDLKLREVRAIYPSIVAINSGRLTRNFTLYTPEGLIGKKRHEDPTGFSSFVKPYGKPILREHRLQDSPGLFGGGEQADIPMGRIVYASYVKRGKDTTQTLPKRGIPGTVEGDGHILIVPSITDETGILSILGGTYHTVSIGASVSKIIESVSGEDIARLKREGKELPSYERGQWYNGSLSYWSMGEIRGLETSFVNVPSDEYAGVKSPDIGLEGLRLLLGESKNNKEFCLFDAKTGDLVKTLDQDDEYSAIDESFEFVDSAEVGRNVWWVSPQNKKEKLSQIIREVLDVE